MAMQKLANKLKGTEKKYYATGTYMTIYWASFYAYYDTFVDFGIITEEKFPKYFKLRKFIESNIFMTIEFEKAIIICEKPIYIKKNERGMHCLTGPAIMWADGYCQFYINGRCMPQWIYEKNRTNTLTKEDFMKENNEDVRAGIYEIIENKGEGSMLNFLGAEEIDKKTIVHNNGDLEELTFYKTKEKYKMETDLNGKSPAPLAWLKLKCPSTYTIYLIPSDGSFNNCIDAAKYHRPASVPKEVEYNWSQRN